MKKAITLLLALMLLLSLCACGSQPVLSEEEPAESTAEHSPSPAPTPTAKPSPSPTPTAKVSPSPTPTEEPSPAPSENTPEVTEQRDTPAPEETTAGEENTPVPPPADTAAPTQKPRVVPDWDYYIKVNCACNTVTIYTYDDNGEYTVPYMAMICSTGADTPQSGFYSFYGQCQWYWLDLFGDVSGQYVSQITGNILFHSVPYLTTAYERDKGTLEYWEFDKLGTACSMGCVRLQVKDAMWIFYNFENIKGVEFYNSSDPGPLGRPSAPIISGNEACRNWDPTDPDENNPWLTWVEPTPEPSDVPTPEPSPGTDP